MESKKIGILVDSEYGLFCNGILQNAYFLMVVLHNAGFVCDLLSLHDTPRHLETVDIKVTQLSIDPLLFDVTKYSTIITVNSSVDQRMYTYLKEHKIFVAGLICGNNMMIDLEDFIHGPHKPGRTSFMGKTRPVDDLWIIPCYYFATEYVSLIRGKPSRIVPHLWAPSLVEETAKMYLKSDESLHYNLKNHVSKKIDILIVEPNLNFYKSAWIPIIACEKLHQTHPELINNIYVFNCPKHEQISHMFDNLTVGPKIKRYARLKISEIMAHFNKQKTMPIIVSHTILNELNYTYYEALHYGWPLVHNSSLLEDCGYKYTDNSFVECATMILNAYENHNKTLIQYNDKSKLFLERVNPFNSEVQLVFKELIIEGELRAQL